MPPPLLLLPIESDRAAASGVEVEEEDDAEARDGTVKDA